MRKTEVMKKALSILLAFCMVLPCVFTTAYAVTEDNLCEHHEVHTAEICGYVEGEADCSYHCEVCHVQELVDALPKSVTAENAAAAAAEALGSVYDATPADTATEAIQIFIKKPGGATLTLEVAPDTTINSIKETIQKKYGYPTANQTLIYNGQQLIDGSKTLTDYSITGEATIQLVVRWNVTIAGTTNGAVTADKATAVEGATVTLTIASNEGYELDSLIVTYGDDNTAVNVAEDNTFTMPAGNVTVTATFKAKAVEPVETNTIYFDNSVALWSTVYAYAWESETGTSYLGPWPGTVMTLVEGETSIYSVTVPAGADTIIFNNGSVQTGDQILGTDNCFKAATDGSGSWYTYPCTHANMTCTDNGDGTHSGTCPDCGADTGNAAHTPENGKCTVCGYQYPFSTYDSYAEDVTPGFYADLDSALTVANGVSSITVLADYTIGEDTEVTLGNSQLLLSEGVTLTNNGTLTFGSLDGFVAGSGTYEGSGTVMIGESKGIVVNNTLYYHGGDVTSSGLDLNEVTNATYYKAGDGYAIFTPASGDTETVLELNDASITGPVSVESSSSVSQAIHCGGNLTIRFSGTNTLTGGEANAESNGIVVGGDLTLTGADTGSVLNAAGGELNGTGSNCGIECDSLIVTNGTVKAVGGAGNGSTHGVSATDVTMGQGATLNAIGGTTAQGNSFGVYAQSVSVDGTVNAVGGASTGGFSAGFGAGIDPISITGSGAANGTVMQIVPNEETSTMTIAYSVSGAATLGASLTPQNIFEDMEGAEEINVIVTFTVPEGTSLIIPAGITLDLTKVDNINIQGDLIVNGTLICSHAYDDSGKCTICGANQPITVILNGNGGEIFNGDTYDYQEMVTVPYSDALALADYATRFEHAHYTLSGWNTEADGTGTSYEVDGSFIVTGDITLYAQWTETTHTVTFVYGMGNLSKQTIGEVTPQALNSYTGDPKTGYTFAGWNTKSDGSGTAYANGQEITLTGDIMLYPQWQVNNHKITWNLDGGQCSMELPASADFGTTFYVSGFSKDGCYLVGLTD